MGRAERHEETIVWVFREAPSDALRRQVSTSRRMRVTMERSDELRKSIMVWPFFPRKKKWQKIRQILSKKRKVLGRGKTSSRGQCRRSETTSLTKCDFFVLCIFLKIILPSPGKETFQRRDQEKTRGTAAANGKK